MFQVKPGSLTANGPSDLYASYLRLDLFLCFYKNTLQSLTASTQTGPVSFMQPKHADANYSCTFMNGGSRPFLNHSVALCIVQGLIKIPWAVISRFWDTKLR